ncbi:DUF4097 family beta strand repeat-containing protein [Hymenobacter jejuensis]|uniref:DUF4097 domain-containing protein n=1 Tax=Hymenobacter jejuensis TaxID=2502781 RepID=A0A5B7ZZH4_9BACT|nr:DUF4097 family beta strand repeat-containing protein [Hymenobacter jejuensis]QDA60269.1 hypothetical protein FHG12_09155 [Hymenobacter jejuensis]
MKTTFLSTLTRPAACAGLLLLALGTAQPLQAQTPGKEQLVVALSAPNKPGTLHVKLVGGAIHVIGYAGKDVLIDAAPRASKARASNSSDGANSQGMKRISRAEGLDLTAREENNRVTISTESWRTPIDLTIKVPQQFSLQIGTVQSGDIVVENVTGELEVSNVNGGIQLTQVGGSAVANTVNGPVTATFKSVTPNAPMAFSSVNGRIDVTFPSNVKTNVKLKSDQGEIYSDFDLAVDKTTPKVNRTSQGNMQRVSVDEWTFGKLNGGGAEVMMKTLNGNIYIRKAK